MKRRVLLVIDVHAGPTCKADNLNNIIAFIKQFEADHDWRFSAIMVHNSEDVIHPYEFKVAIQYIYGFRSVIFACLFPPLMPIRLVWGNVINLAAPLGAWNQLFFGTQKSGKTKKATSHKTDHELILGRVHSGIYGAKTG